VAFLKMKSYNTKKHEVIKQACDAIIVPALKMLLGGDSYGRSTL